MSENNNNKEDKEFSFIQEQITSKKKSRIKRLLYSIIWTVVLACIFGIVAGVTFCLSEPTISKFFGKEQEKKTVEFPTVTQDEEDENTQDSISPTPTGTDKTEDNNDDNTSETDTANAENETDSQDSKDEKSEVDTLVIERSIKGDLSDLTSIYSELREISNEVNESIVTVSSISSGVDLFNNEYDVTKVTTGLVVADNGADILILVSMDKIKDANTIQVTFSDAYQSEAVLQDYESDLNLAVIAVSLENIPDYNLAHIKTATLGESYSLILGTPIIALGAPNGYVGSLEFGIITSKGFSVYTTDNKIELFNTDVNYNENGDGVIVNLYGEVIGVITHALEDEENKEVTSVIGITRIKKIIESLANNADRIYFGIKGEDMTDAALKEAQISNGICVTEVEADSPALGGGLKSGDIIIAMNEIPIMSVNAFHNQLSGYEPETTVEISIRRSIKNVYKDMDIKVELVKKDN